MHLYVNLDTMVLVAGPATTGSISPIQFKRGDTEVVNVMFLQAGSVPVLLADGLTPRFSCKIATDFGAQLAIDNNSWSAPADGYFNYTFTPSLNTTVLNALLGYDPTNPNNSDLTANVLLNGEIILIDGSGNQESTLTFPVTAYNDVFRGTESAPTSGEMMTGTYHRVTGGGTLQFFDEADSLWYTVRLNGHSLEVILPGIA